MKQSFFGTDGIRGTVGTDPITARFTLELGHALGTVLKQQTPQPQVLIGKDTRLSGYMLESALESGLISAGVDVVLLGPIPTPAVAYLVRAQRADLGVVISASHNLYQDNGLKFFSAAGTKLPDSWEQAIEKALAQTPNWATAMQLGRAKRLDDASGRYIEFCKSTFDKNLNLKGLKLVVDAAHGAAYQIAPAVFHELGAEVIKIGCSPDGVNINHEVGATSPKALQQAVLEHQADFGIALDGDADRLQMVNKQGHLFNGDELLYILALDRLTLGEQVPGVVGTLMTNMAIEQALKELKVSLVRAQVGDRYVLEQLEKNAWLLGGESSGHLLALDKHSTGDAIISALQVLQHCVRAQKSLEDILHGVCLYPQTMLNVKISKNSDWAQNPSFINTKAEVEAQLGTLGRVLIRPSGTEPVVRVMVEGQDKKQCDALAQQLKDSLTA